MKKKVFAIALLFSCVLASCSKAKKASLLTDLDSEDISQITIVSLKTEQITNITEEDKISNILLSMKDLPLYVKSEKSNTYDTQLVQYTLHKTTGEDVVIEVIEPWIGYNKSWYACDTNTCKSLSDLAYEYLSE